MNEDKNVKVIQDVYAAWQRGDVRGILGKMDPTVMFTILGSQAVPLAGTRHGLEGVRQYLAELEKTLEFTMFEPRDYIAQGNRVVALVHCEGRNRNTWRTFCAETAMVWTVQAGKIIRFVEYSDTEQFARSAVPMEQVMGAH